MANNVSFGFLSLEHMFNSRVNEVGVERIYSAIQESLQVHTQELDGLMAVFVEKTTKAQEQYELPGTGTLQPLTESGSPKPVRPGGSYTVAYPIQGGGTAWATNRVTQAVMTVQEANRFTWDASIRDADWMIRHCMAAVLDNATWSFDDKIGPDGSKGLGAITIQPLANGDSVKYVKRATGAASTDNHYLYQLAAIDDSNNPFPTMRDELTEHPSNTGPFVVYVPTNLRDTVGALSEFVELNDPAIRVAADNDEITGALPALGPGDEIIGFLKSSKFWVIEWGRLPSSYMIAQARGAERSIKMREWFVEELQGFFTETFRPESGLSQVNLIRYAGFGASNRVSALVIQIGAGAYSVPSGYDAPLSV